jgi:hypothetical protein
LFRQKLVVPTGVQAEGAAGGKATAALRDGVVGGGFMDGGIGRGSSEMRMVAAVRTTKSSGMGASVLVGSGGADSCGGGAGGTTGGR